MTIKIKDIENLRVVAGAGNNAIHFEVGDHRYHIWMNDRRGLGIWIPYGWIYRNPRQPNKVGVTTRASVDAASNEKLMQHIQSIITPKVVRDAIAARRTMLEHEKIRMETERRAELAQHVRDVMNAMALNSNSRVLDAFATLIDSDDETLISLAEAIRKK